MDRFVPHVDVVEGEGERLPDPDAGPEKEKDQGTVSDAVYDGEEFLRIRRVDRPGQNLGKLQFERLFQE